MSFVNESELASCLTDLVALRHDLHRHPELGFEEHRTQAKVRARLEAAGYEPRDCAGTGLVADLHREPRPGRPTVALRADMDCLPIHESTELEYRSVHPGQSHKCGHDGHTAILVGVAEALARIRERVDLNVRLLFQPAEEGVRGGGARVMVREEALAGVHEIYGLHNWPGFPRGELRVCDGITMAEVNDFDATVRGFGGHASQPQQCRDPVVAGAELISSWHAMVSRSVGAGGGAVLSVCQVAAGETRNAIPDCMQIAGTLRVFDANVGDRVRARMAEIAEGLARAWDVTIEYEMRRGYPVLVNAPACAEVVRRVGARVYGESKVSSRDLPMAGGEDFAYFARERPGAYFFLGSGHADGKTPGCHHPDFDFDDELIPLGIRMFLGIVEDRAVEAKGDGIHLTSRGDEQGTGSATFARP